jgi:4-hydroxybenzoate polyprenyltransferase
MPIDLIGVTTTERIRSMQDNDVPLCVDLDGTLIRSDLSVESVLALLRRNPLHLFSLLVWYAKGWAHVKREIAKRMAVDASVLPYDERVLAWLREATERPRVLCTASDQIYADAVAAYVGGFDVVLGSDGSCSLGGRVKAAALCDRYGDHGFDYAGNAPVDLHVWRHSRRAIVVDAPPRLLERVRRIGDVERVFPRRGGRWRAWLAALRPHQWLKNALVFVPLLAAHLAFVPDALMRSLTAFCAFSLCASGAYVLNDLFDLDADRHHPRKRLRPFAAGLLPLRSGLIAAPLLTLAAFAIASTLSPRFMLVLLSYAVVTLVYSLLLKRIAMLDVVTLAALYTIRIIAGAVAIPVEASFWLLAFSMFLFLSLAMTKRYTEIRRVAAGSDTKVAGRGYGVDDLPLIQSLGTSSGYLSVLVLAFYINSTASTALYRHHEVLWVLAPILLYWISRVWLLARRDEMHDDPVVFALTDRVSLGVLGVFALVIFLAI